MSPLARSFDGFFQKKLGMLFEVSVISAHHSCVLVAEQDADSQTCDSIRQCSGGKRMTEGRPAHALKLFDRPGQLFEMVRWNRLSCDTLLADVPSLAALLQF
jgi:hypothetical protein